VIPGEAAPDATIDPGIRMATEHMRAATTGRKSAALCPIFCALPAPANWKRAVSKRGRADEIDRSTRGRYGRIPTPTRLGSLFARADSYLTRVK